MILLLHATLLYYYCHGANNKCLWGSLLLIHISITIFTFIFIITTSTMIAVESGVTETPLGWRMPPRDLLGSRGASSLWYEFIMMTMMIINLGPWQSWWPHLDSNDDGGIQNWKLWCWGSFVILSPPRTKFIVGKIHPIFIQKLGLWRLLDFECISNSVLLKWHFVSLVL